MEIKIVDVFRENKFNIFRSHCSNKGMFFMRDLVEYDFSQLKNVDGIGTGKYNSIMLRYRTYLSEANLINDVVVNAEHKKNVNTMFCFDEIEIDNFGIELKYFKKIFLSNKQIEALKDQEIKTVGELYKTVGEVSFNEKNKKSYEVLYKIVCQPTSDLIESIYKMICAQENFSYFLKRTEGYTLQNIGDLMGVTRERVRQICKKYEDLLGYFGEYIIKLKCKGDDRLIVKSDEFNSLFNIRELAVSIIYALKQNKNIQYIDFIDSFKLRDEKHILLESLNEIKNDIIGDFINIYEKLDEVEMVLQKNGVFYIDALDSIEYYVSKGYILAGDYLIRSSISYTCPSIEIIKKYYPDGIKIYDDNEQMEMRKLVIKEFPYLKFPQNIRAVAARLADNLILCGRGKYIHKSRVNIEKGLLNEIYDNIIEQSSPSLLYHEIFERFKGKLNLLSSINNRHYLHGVLREYYPDEFLYERDVMHKKDGVRLSIADRISEFILSKGQPVKFAEIKKQIKGITDAIIVNSLMSHRKIIQWESGYVSHIGLTNFTDEDIACLRDGILNIMSANEGYCSSTLLYERIKLESFGILERNNVKNHMNLYYSAMFYLETEFSFKRPHITEINFNYDDVSMVSLLEKNLLLDNTISYNEVVSFGKKMGWSIVTLYSAFKRYSDKLFRLNIDKFQLEESVDFSSEIIESLRKYIIGNMHDGFLPLNTLYNFDILPEVCVEWNPFLIESIIEKYIVDLRLVYPKVTDRRYCRGVVVRTESLDKDYFSLAKRVVENAKSTVVSAERIEYLLSMNSLFYNIDLAERIENELSNKYN